MTDDVADAMLESLRRALSIPTALTAKDLWPACFPLCDAGVLMGDEEHLASVRRGPFRIAGTRYDDAVVDFVEVLLPTGIVAGSTRDFTLGAITAAAAGVCKTFAEILRRGVVFGRSPQDRERWSVLMVVRSLTLSEGGATPTEIIEHLTQGGQLTVTPESVEDALRWLSQAPSTMTKREQTLIRLDGDGRYQSVI